MLTILHFSRDFTSDKPQLGGFSRILNICRDGNQHYIFTYSFVRDDVFDFILEDKITVIEIPYKKANFRIRNQIKFIPQVVQSILAYVDKNRLKIDLLFGHSQLINFFILGGVKNRLNGTPLIWEMNAIWGHRHANGLRDKLMLRILSWIQKIVIIKSDHVVVHSRESEKYVVKQFNVSKRKMTVITNAITNNEVIKANKVTIVRNPKKFVCLGFFDEMNGISFFIDYLKNHCTRNIDISFFGSGALESEIVNLSKSGKCVYGGVLKRKDMIEKLSQFDYVVIPRLPRKEADLFIPTKLIEAMANGLVPVCSDVKGMSEVVTHNKNGLLFSAGSIAEFDLAIEYALNITNDDYLKLKNNAIETIVNGYSWDNNHRVLNQIYHQLINCSNNK